MRWSNIIIIVMVSGAIGWYLHGYLQIQSEPAISPTKFVKPEPVDLRGYHTGLPTFEADPVAPGDSQLQLNLRTGNYTDAVAHYNQLLDSATKQQSEIQRLAILEYVNELYRARSVDNALKLLNLFLESNYRDVAALRLKANILASRKDYKQQLEVLYDAKAYAYLDRDIDSIVHEIRLSVDKYKQYLVSQQNHADLLVLYQDLVYQEPDYSPYFIELAKAQLTNKLEYDARQSLELVAFDPLVGLQAQQLLAELNDTGEQSDKTIALFDDSRTIPLQRRGNHFVVEAILNNQTRLNLVIDTGASLTIIKPELLPQGIGSSLGHHPQYLFNTANGVVKAPVLKVDLLAIGEFEVTNLQVGGLALTEASGIDGLLGMNFLKHFRFFIDQENNVLRLSLNN